MAEIQMQQQGQSLRTGFFDRDAFQRKARTILVLKTAVAGMFGLAGRRSGDSEVANAGDRAAAFPGYQQ